MKNREIKDRSLTVDDLYEKDLIESVVNYGNAQKELKEAEKEAGVYNPWEHLSTWFWIAVGIYVLIRVLFV